MRRIGTLRRLDTDWLLERGRLHPVPEPQRSFRKVYPALREVRELLLSQSPAAKLFQEPTSSGRHIRFPTDPRFRSGIDLGHQPPITLSHRLEGKRLFEQRLRDFKELHLR